VEIEIRQDLLGDTAGQGQWAERITRALQEAESQFEALGPPRR
jgi:predicted N-formylglutamate amidohydrolase